MFTFSNGFIRDVKEHFGSGISPRLNEALDEGDHKFVENFLRGSRKQPSWDLFYRSNFLELKVLADGQTRLQALYSRCLSETCIQRSREINAA